MCTKIRRAAGLVIDNTAQAVGHFVAHLEVLQISRAAVRSFCLVVRSSLNKSPGLFSSQFPATDWARCVSSQA